MRLKYPNIGIRGEYSCNELIHTINSLRKSLNYGITDTIKELVIYINLDSNFSNLLLENLYCTFTICSDIIEQECLIDNFKVSRAILPRINNEIVLHSFTVKPNKEGMVMKDEYITFKCKYSIK